MGFSTKHIWTSGPVVTFTAEHDAVLNYLYREFRATGQWPTTTSVDIAFRTQGNAKRLISEIGREIAVWEWSGLESRCYLTLRGLRTRRAAETDIANFLLVVRYLGKRYVEMGGAVEVSESDLSDTLGLPAIDARRAAEFVRREPDLLASYVSPPGGALRLTPHRFTARLENVRSLEEYWEIHDQFLNDERAACFAAQGPPDASRLTPRPAPVAGALEKLSRFLQREKARRGLLWAVAAAVLGLLLAAAALF